MQQLQSASIARSSSSKKGIASSTLHKKYCVMISSTDNAIDF